MKKRIIIIGVIVVLIAAIGLKLASNKKKIDENNKPVLTSNVAIPVTAITASRQNVNEQLVKTGTLVPFKEADIMAISSGKLTVVNFNLGTRVSEGAK
jgi:multidrug efflux pump subunit AcrA (membrane-fusion protein)